jgi:hypothetical protein
VCKQHQEWPSSASARQPTLRLTAQPPNHWLLNANRQKLSKSAADPLIIRTRIQRVVSGQAYYNEVSTSHFRHRRVLAENLAVVGEGRKVPLEFVFRSLSISKSSCSKEKLRRLHASRIVLPNALPLSRERLCQAPNK